MADEPASNAIDAAVATARARGSIAQFRTQATASGLLPGEDRLLQAAVSGGTCSLGPGRPDDAVGDRVVRGAFLAFLALGGDESVRVHERGLVLFGAFVEGGLYLVGAHCKSALFLQSCCFGGEIALDYAHLPLMMLDGSKVPGIRGDLLQVDGGVFLQNGFLATGQVRFYGARIGGDLDCRGSTFDFAGKAEGGQAGALVCSNARIGGNVELRDGFCANGQVRFTNAQIGGSVSGDGGRFLQSSPIALAMNSASVGGHVSLALTTIAGQVDLRQASIGGALTLSSVAMAGEPVGLGPVGLPEDGVVPAGVQVSRAVIRGQRAAEGVLPGSLGLLAASCVVKGSARLRGAFRAGASLYGAHVGGTLYCSGAWFGAEGLDCANATVGGNVFMQHEGPRMEGGRLVLGTADLFRADGPVSFSGATIGGSLVCAGAEIVNPAGLALDCSSVVVKGSVYLSVATMRLHEPGAAGGEPVSAVLGAAFSGAVGFAGADIGGNLDCSGSRFEAPGGVALDGSAARVGGSVLLARSIERRGGAGPTVLELSEAFRAIGLVNLYGVAIGVDLVCTGGDFQNGGGMALDFSKSRIKGNATLSCGFLEAEGLAFGFDSQGTVSLYGADITGDLECSGGRFACVGGPAIQGAAVRIGGVVNLRRVVGAAGYGPAFRATGEVDFTAAKIGSYLQCDGGQFSNPEANALSCSAIEVGGSVFLSRSDEPAGGAAAAAEAVQRAFTAEGRVNFAFAQIRRVLLCQGGRFRNALPDPLAPREAAAALDLSNAVVDTLVLGVAQAKHTPAVVEGSISLEGAHVRQLVDAGFGGGETFPPLVAAADKAGTLRCTMTLDGFVYERLGGISDTSVAARKAWLDRQPLQHLSAKTFRPQPFDQLVRALRAAGEEDGARSFAIYKQQRVTGLFAPGKRALAVLLLVGVVAAALFAALAPSPVVPSAMGWLVVAGLLFALHATGGLGWLVRSFLGVIVGYGYRPVGVLLVAVLLGGGFAEIYRQAAEQGVFVLKAAEHAGCGPEGRPCAAAPFLPAVYSLDTMLPLKLGQAEKWTVLRRPFALRLPGLRIEVAEWVIEGLIVVEIVFGWIAGGIILGLVTGVLKKE